jgi:hypothetical protein
VDVVRVEASVPGLELVEVAGLAAPLRHRERRGVDLVFRVTDCRAVPSDPWPVHLTTTRAWGTSDVTIDIGGYPRDPASAPSNGQLTERVCSPR